MLFEQSSYQVTVTGDMSVTINGQEIVSGDIYIVPQGIKTLTIEIRFSNGETEILHVPVVSGHHTLDIEELEEYFDPSLQWV